jgi:ACT domain-containing protein
MINIVLYIHEKDKKKQFRVQMSIKSTHTSKKTKKKTQIPMNKEHLNTMQPQEEPTFYE